MARVKVILFGATGMIGQGVLRECLLDERVESVLVVTRSSTGQKNAKLREIIHADFADLSAIESELAGYDACFYCLGVSSVGMSEVDYTRVTYDYALAAGRVLARLNPSLTFVFISGGGTDSSEKGGSMWARVKGKTENALLALPFHASFMFRPAMIIPMHGIVSRTRLYRIVYAILAPIYPVLKALLPSVVTTTDNVSKAMLLVATDNGASKKRVLENRDINEIVTRAPSAA
jgi:uncharacterized protein YbjT (DUF2867 family)